MSSSTILKLLPFGLSAIGVAAGYTYINKDTIFMSTKTNKDGKLIYVSGETISVDLDKDLLKEGYKIKRIINYRTNHNKNRWFRIIEKRNRPMEILRRANTSIKIYVFASFLNSVKI